MSNAYIDADTLNEAREALRLGCQLEYLAGKLRCSPEHLARLLDLPVKPAANMVAEPSVDLWAVERSQEVL